MDPGINKPFDRAAKELAAESPRLLLKMLGLIPPGREFQLDPLPQETAPPVAMTDYVARLCITGEPPCTFHLEFFARYRSDIPSTMTRYGTSLAMQYWRRVESVLLLLREEGTPASIPSFGEISIGPTRATHEFRTIRLWEQDPEVVLATEDPAVMPWALLMRLGKEEAKRLGSKVAATGNESWIARFLTVGSLRYDRKDLEDMLGGPNMGLIEAIKEGSSFCQESRDEGRQEGARRSLKLALAAKTPGLEALPEIERISSVDQLEAILLHVIGGSDRATIHRAIQTAATGGE